MIRSMTVAVLAGALMATSPAAADTVRLVTGNGYKPFTDESLEGGGMFTQLVVAAYEMGGHEVETVDFLPWKRGEKLVQAGKYTATFPLVVTEERKKLYVFSDPVYTAETKPIVQKEKAGTITSFDAMKGKTYCMPLGWNPTNTIRGMVDAGEIKRQSPREFSSCFKMIQAGRVDFTELEKPSIPWEVESALGSADALHVEDFVTQDVPLYVVFSKDSPTVEEDVKAFNEALAKLKASDKYDEIVSKFVN